MIDLRRWPLLVPVFAAVIGLMLSRSDLFVVPVAVTLLIITVALLLLIRQRMALLLLTFGALLGAVDLVVDASRVVVPEAWLQGEMVVTAEVENVERLPSSRRYLLSHVKRDDGESLPGRALLYHYLRASKVENSPVEAGQSVRVRVSWRLPRNYLNPGFFDYRAWCFDRHIALIGNVRGEPVVTATSVPWLQLQRQKVRRALAEGDKSDDGVLPALLLAERSNVSESANRLFSATGTAHLLAISGMHVGMAAAWVFALVWFVLTRRETWIIHFPVRNIALLSGVLAAAAYASIAGWPLPAVRAAVMLAAAALAWCLSSRSEPVNTLLAALALILISDPAAVASLSLWLSFVATASLLLWAGAVKQSVEASSWRQRLGASAKALLWVSLLATLATLPLIISTFGSVPVYSLSANMILVPLYALFVMPAALLGELCALIGLDALAAWLISFAVMVVGVGLNYLSVLTSLPAGELWAGRPSLLLGLFYGLGMLVSGWLLWSGKKLQAACAAIVVLTIYIIGVLSESEVQEPEWIVWDVGQGAASTLLLPHNRVIVIDAPGRTGSRFNGGTTVAAGLRALGLTHIDLLVLTHAQSDHLGGALSLMRNVNSVGQICLPDVPDAHADKRVKAIETYAAAKNIPIQWLGRGDVTLLQDGSGGQLSLNVLWPPRSSVAANANNTSLVMLAELRLQSLERNVKMLWAGDIETEAERSLLKAGIGSVDVMLMPHHGSRSSSHEAFVARLQANLVVAQTGFDNRYGFPIRTIVQRYQKHGARVKNSADGAVFLRWPAGKRNGDLLQWSENNGGRRDMVRAWWEIL